VVICLQRGADLHTAQLMPLPFIVSCFSKIQIGFTFLVPAYPGSPGQRAVKRVCVCVCAEAAVVDHYFLLPSEGDTVLITPVTVDRSIRKGSKHQNGNVTYTAYLAYQPVVVNNFTAAILVHSRNCLLQHYSTS